MIPRSKADWNTGSGTTVSFRDIIKILKKSVLSGAKIYIGTDSSTSKSNIVFATAICVYNSIDISRYFFLKTKCDRRKYGSLTHRITEEVNRSVTLAETLISKYNISYSDIELHLDISPLGVKTRTSKFSDSLKNYVLGAGFGCKIKPNAWASQTVADKHSK